MARFWHRRIGSHLLRLTLAGALLAALGCGGGSAPAPSGDDRRTDGTKSDSNTPRDRSQPDNKTPATPRAALLQAIEGLLTGNDEQLFQVVKADDKQKELLRAITQYEKNVQAFKDAFVKAYDAAAWTRFTDPANDPGMGEGKANLPIHDLKEEQEAINKAMLVEEKKGQEAWCEYTDKRGKATRLTTVKEGDVWRVEAAGLLPPGDPEQQLKKYRTLAALVKKYQKAIGKPGIKPDDIDVELGKAAQKELLDIRSSKEPRFDIDKIKD